ncbi:MAG: hypothetical protein H0U27_06945 [Nitrosopumilus sp.]|nr:hypothetical protein [Nitrosopumilus sp.]
MKIQDKVGDLNFANMDEFNKILEKPNVKIDVTFWGTRTVTIEGFEGSIPLEEISQKIILATKADSKSNQLTNKVRLSGLNLTEKVCSFYSESDEIARGRNFNFLTKCLMYVREYKRDIRERTFTKLSFDVMSYFHLFDKVQFEKYFEGDFEDVKPFWDKTVEQIMVSRDQIENLVNKEENKPLKSVALLIGGNIFVPKG